MAAELGSIRNAILGEFDVDLGELHEVVKKIMGAIPKADSTNIKGFGDKHYAKSTPCDGEKEEEFKSGTEKFTFCMAGAGDKKWQNIIREIQKREHE